MVAESCKHQSELDELVNTAGLQNVQPFDPHLARILITELLWGKGYLKPENARAIRIILELENDLRQALDSMNSQEENDSVHQVSGRLIHFVLFCIFSSFKTWSLSRARDFTRRSTTVHPLPFAPCSFLVLQCSPFRLLHILPQFIS